MVALLGLIVAFSWPVLPAVRFMLVWFRLTLSTLTAGAPPASTVTLHSAVLSPSAVVTVMVAVPALWAVTFPFPSTVATLELLEDQVTFLFVALFGSTVAVSWLVLPSVRVRLVLFRLTPVTETKSALLVSFSV